MSSEFLSELPWEDGFAIPVANQENKMLEDEVRRTGWKLGDRQERTSLATERGCEAEG